MFWGNQDFKRLKREWDEKLRESGFEDAEKEVGGERVLRQSADYAYRRKETVGVIRECKLEYFTLLSQKIEETRFEDGWDRLIMEMTAEGKSIREISDHLKALIPKGRKRTKHNRMTICYVRRRYEHKWGIRTWKPEEMQSRKARTR